jgi:hypothetical protein
MSQTYYLANKVMDYNFGQTSYTVPSTLYFGLSTTVIGNDGNGATEPVGNGYARVAVTNNKTNFSSSSNGVLSNLIAVSFPESTASWGTITYIGIWDALSSGNVLYFEALSSSRSVQPNTTVVFAIGALTFSMTNT